MYRLASGWLAGPRPGGCRWDGPGLRMIRNSGVATKQAVTAPRSKHAASHRESAGSRFGRPGRFLTCLASASTHSSPSASSR